MQHCTAEDKLECKLTCSNAELRIWYSESYDIREYQFQALQGHMARYVQAKSDEAQAQGRRPDLLVQKIITDYSKREWESFLARA